MARFIRELKSPVSMPPPAPVRLLEFAEGSVNAGWEGRRQWLSTLFPGSSSRLLEALDLGLCVALEAHLVAGVFTFKNPNRLIGFAGRRVAFSGSWFLARHALISNGIRRHLCRFAVGTAAGRRQSRDSNHAGNLDPSPHHDVPPSLAKSGLHRIFPADCHAPYGLLSQGIAQLAEIGIAGGEAYELVRIGPGARDVAGIPGN